MTDFWLAALEWTGRSILAGGTALLLGWVAVRFSAAPVLKQRIATWSILAAVLAPVLCLFPAWLTLTVPLPGAAEPVAHASPIGEPVPLPDEPVLGLLPDEALDGIWFEPAPADLAGLADEPGTAVTPPAPAEVSLQPPAVPATPLTVVETIAPILLLPYTATVLVLFGQLLVGHLGLLRLRSSAVAAPDRVQGILRALTAHTGTRAVVLVSDRIASPVCFGFFRPAIVLPRKLAIAATESQLRWVLAHELDHLHRGDPLTGWWAGLARAVYFFVPWFWPLRRELALAQEYLADAAAAEADGRVVDYAEFLVDLSGDRARLPLAAFAVRAGSSDLFRRVTMLLNGRAGANRPTRRWAVLAAGGVVTATFLLSGIGLAADDQAKPRKVVVVPVDPDRQVEKDVIIVQAIEKENQDKARPKKPVRDGEKPRAAQKDRDTRKLVTPDGQRIELRSMNMAEIMKIKEALMAAAREGDHDEVRRQMERLEKALMAGPLRVIGPEGMRVPLPPVPPVPPVPGIDAAQIERAQAEMKKAQKAFSEAIEKLKDNPEAREALEKAQGEYKKAMEMAREKLQAQLKERGALRGLGQFDPEAMKEFRNLRLNPRAFAFGGQPRFGVAAGSPSEELADQLGLAKGVGVLVQSVVPDSTAEKAGLQKNDIILSFGGKTVSGENFATVVGETKPGKVDVVIIRKGKRQTLKGIELPAQAEGRLLEVKPFGVGGARVFPRGAFGPGPLSNFQSVSVSVNDGDFKIDATRDDVRYRLSGTIAEGKKAVESIAITEGKKKTEYDSLEEVPEAHREAIQQLLGSVGGGR